MEHIVLSLQHGKSEDEIIKAIDFENSRKTDLKLEEWTASSSNLNLFQLAVLHRQKSVVEYLISQFRNFMRKDLYLASRTSIKVQGSTLTGSESDLPNRQPPECSDQQQTDIEPQALPASQQSVSTTAKQTKSSQERESLVNHPLHLACCLGDVDIVRCLTRPPHPPAKSPETKKFSHHQDRFQPLPLDRSKEDLQDLMKTVSVITVELSNESFMGATGVSQKTLEGLPLELAVSSGSVGCVKYLLSSVLLPWVSSQYYFICMELKRKAVNLHLACCFSAPKMVALLLPSLSKDILHCRDGQGQTPLHFAVWSGDTDTIRLLLENGADPNALTDSSYSCLHILYRSMLNPLNYEANTCLLLEFGADANISDRECGKSGGGKMSPLHVLVEEILDSLPGTLNMWERCLRQRENRGLSAYTQSKQRKEITSTYSDYIQRLLRCVRLLLEAGADPNTTADTSQESSKTVLEMILIKKQMSLERESLFALLSTLLEFGATLTQMEGISHLVSFLSLPGVADERLINLFCEHGVDATTVARVLLSQHRQHLVSLLYWNQASLLMLANKMSVHDLEVLAEVCKNQHMKDIDFDFVTSPLYGSPVRSLRHSCKVVVLRYLGHKGCQTDRLPVPNVIKSYLRAHDYN